jgi:uncharacterized protein YndB with AHSA1/START domain
MPAAARSEPTANREIVLERTFAAPRSLVWKAFTEPRHLDRWWGPNGFRNQTHAMDFREGGTWRFEMRAPDGKIWPNWIRFEEIAVPERLVYAHGGEGDEAHFHVTVTFADLGRRTKVTMRSVFPTAEACEAVKKSGAVEGGRQTLARLEGYLPSLADGSSDRDMVLSRLFDAPAKLVFEAWSKPAMLARWWGPRRFTLPVCEIDFRRGGAYRLVMRDPEGREYPFHGTYSEIVENERIVFTAKILPGVEVVTTVTFAEEGGKTLLTVQQTVPADASAARGQLEGWNGSLEKLAAVLTGAA